MKPELKSGRSVLKRFGRFRWGGDWEVVRGRGIDWATQMEYFLENAHLG